VKWIKPAEISARILTLFDESDERVIIVSPYMKISKWYKLVNKVNELKTRRILTEIYVRDDPDNTATYHDLDKLALPYTKIPHLHCKLYLNERYGIITSMNLLLSSEINSLEIGYATETWAEYNDLLGFYQRYIHIGEPVNFETIAGQPAINKKVMIKRIREEIRRTSNNSWPWFEDNCLHIWSGGSNYIVSIKDGYLSVTARLRMSSSAGHRSIEQTKLIVKKVSDLTTMKTFGHTGLSSENLHLSAQGQCILKSPCITRILEAEMDYVIKSIRRFIDTTNALVVQDTVDSA
jgi:hypothetical protein